MKKKKNRNIKMTIAAGLLITPAIVAQAGEVQASTNTEALLTPFNKLNESNLSTLQTQAANLAIFKADGNTDGLALDALDTNLLALMEAKITYLQSYIEHKKTAEGLESRMGKLSTTSGTFATDYAQITADLAALKADFKSSLTTLDTAAVIQTGDYQQNLLDGLKYYKKGTDFDADTELFITAIIGTTTLTSFENKGTLLENVNTVIDGPVNQLVQVLGEPTSSKQAIKDKVTAVETEIAKLTSAERISIHAHKVTVSTDSTVQVSVKDLITAIKTGFENAEKVSDDITALLVKPPTSTTTLKSRIEAIAKTYDKVPTYLQRFVTNYTEQLTQLNAALKVSEDINKVLKKTDTITELLTNIGEIDTAYNQLTSQTYKGLVTNYDELKAFKETLESVNALQTALADPATAHSAEDVAGFIADFNKISTTNHKYFTPANLTLLKGWVTNVKSATTIDAQINKLSTANLATIATAADSKKLSTTKSFINSVNTVYKEYVKIPQLDTGFNPRTLVKEGARLQGLKDIVTITEKVIVLTPESARNQETLTAVTGALSGFSAKAATVTADTANLTHLGTYLTDFVDAIQSENAIVDTLIEEITNLEQNVDLFTIASIRERYNKLSKASQKLVSNYAQFTALEKMYKDAVTVTGLIEKLDPETKDFISKTTSAKNAYEKLTPAIKETITNKDMLISLSTVTELMTNIDKLRATDKEFRTKLADLQTAYGPLSEVTEGSDKLSKAKARLVKEYGPKLTAFQSTLSTAEAMITQIANLSTQTGQAFMTSLADLTERYKLLDSATKANITNAALLTSLEKDYKSALKVYNLVEQLPGNTDKNFPSKVATAEKAYQSLTTKQKGYVYNYTPKLAELVKPAGIIARIDKLKIGSKTYEADVVQMREEYKALTPQQQGLVHNVKKLDSAEQGMANADAVIKLIDLAIPTAENYIEKLIAARTAYNDLPKTEQKLVLNYKELQKHERLVKPVLKLDNDILALNPSIAKTFISKYKSAQKAYEKLTMAERGLLINADKLTGELTILYNVINSISSIKSSSKTFVEDTKKARTLYDALSGDLKAKVSNYSILQDHERNVEGGKAVDAMIRALNSSEPKEFIANVKDARAAYKSLSSANKKAVTLEAELKELENYIKPVETAIKAIDDLSDPRKDLSRQFATVNKALQKLDETQMTYVTNMDNYSNLSNVIHAYTLIAALKPNDKYYQGNIDAAKTAYEKLSEEEKVKVTNYYKLQEALLDMTEVQKVTSMIASLNAAGSSYFADIEKGLAAYKELPSGSRKHVLNYALLQQAEKDMKAAQKVINQIEELDPELRTYASKAKSAQKAYEKLTVTQKTQINNYNKLQAAIFELGL